MTIKETFALHGENLVKKVKELIAEGNVTRITITDKNNKDIASFPLTIGVVGLLLAPVLAAVGAIAAFVGDCSVTVEKQVDEETK